MLIKTFTANSTPTAMDLVCDGMRNVSVIVSFYQENEGLARGVAALEPLDRPARARGPTDNAVPNEAPHE